MTRAVRRPESPNRITSLRVMPAGSERPRLSARRVGRASGSLMCALAFGVLLSACGKGGRWEAHAGARPEQPTSFSSTASKPPATPAPSRAPTAPTPKTTGSTEPTPVKPAPPAPAGTNPAAPTVSSPKPAVQQPLSGTAAVASCRRGLQALRHVEPSTRRKLEALCRHANDPNPQAKREAAQEACRALVKTSPLPAGTSRERALATCGNGA